MRPAVLHVQLLCCDLPWLQRTVIDLVATVPYQRVAHLAVRDKNAQLSHGLTAAVLPQHTAAESRAGERACFMRRRRAHVHHERSAAARLLHAAQRVT
jgi:hypothetical protein